MRPAIVTESSPASGFTNSVAPKISMALATEKALTMLSGTQPYFIIQ